MIKTIIKLNTSNALASNNQPTSNNTNITHVVNAAPVSKPMTRETILQSKNSTGKIELIQQHQTADATAIVTKEAAANSSKPPVSAKKTVSASSGDD